MIHALMILRIIAAASTLAPVETRALEIVTPRGARLEARMSRPVEAAGLLPAVVLAPGVGYHMDQPLIKRTAQRLAEQGFAALRFDWGFYTNRTPRGRGLGNEIEDLRAALALLREDQTVDRKRIFVLGKSLGSLAAVATADEDRDLAGLVVLTFAMHDHRRPQAVRPVAQKLTNLNLPILIVGGDKDPLCDTQALDKLVRQCRLKPEVLIVPGDHTLQAGSTEATERSIERAVTGMVNWLSRQAGPASSPSP